MDFLIAVEKSMGSKPLYEYKGYKETYASAADTWVSNRHIQLNINSTQVHYCEQRFTVLFLHTSYDGTVSNYLLSLSELY